MSSPTTFIYFLRVGRPSDRGKTSGLDMTESTCTLARLLRAACLQKIHIVAGGGATGSIRPRDPPQG